MISNWLYNETQNTQLHVLVHVMCYTVSYIRRVFTEFYKNMANEMPLLENFMTSTAADEIITQLLKLIAYDANITRLLQHLLQKIQLLLSY